MSISNCLSVFRSVCLIELSRTKFGSHRFFVCHRHNDMYVLNSLIYVICSCIPYRVKNFAVLLTLEPQHRNDGLLVSVFNANMFVWNIWKGKKLIKYIQYVLPIMIQWKIDCGFPIEPFWQQQCRMTMNLLLLHRQSSSYHNPFSPNFTAAKQHGFNQCMKFIPKTDHSSHFSLLRYQSFVGSSVISGSVIQIFQSICNR